MKSQLLAFAVASVLFNSYVLAQDQAEPKPSLETSDKSVLGKVAKFSVGSVKYEIPAPEGMVFLPKQQFAKLYQIMQSAQPAGNVIQALFYVPEEIEAMMQGKQAALTRHGMAYTLAMSSPVCSLATFEKSIKPEIRKLGEGQSNKDVKDAVDEAKKKVEKLTDATISFMGFRPVHAESDRHIATSLIMNGEAEGKSMAGTLAVVLVKAHALAFAVYEDQVTDQKEGINDSRVASASWVKQIVKENPTPVEQQAAEAAADESLAFKLGEKVGTYAIYGAVIGLVIWLVRKASR